MQWKAKNKTKWYKWFAWYPVFIHEEKTWVWLEPIYLRYYSNDRESGWEGKTKKVFVEWQLNGRPSNTYSRSTGVST